MPPKSEIENRSNRHLTHSRLQVMNCTVERYCLLHVVDQGPGSFRGRSTFLYNVRLRSYGASNLPNFRILAYFSLYKTPKTYLPVTSLQPRGLHRRIIPIFPSGSRRSKEVPSRTGDFLRLLLVGVLGTPELAQIFATHNATILLASDLDQRCLKTCNSEDECTFSPNIFASTPKITPKPHFGGPFNAKPIIQRALRQLHVNGTTTLKLYGYIGVGKYMEVYQTFR